MSKIGNEAKLILKLLTERMDERTNMIIKNSADKDFVRGFVSANIAYKEEILKLQRELEN